MSTPTTPLIQQLLQQYLPREISTQCSASEQLKKITAHCRNPSAILDLGCGRGDSQHLFTALVPATHWIGLDIRDSPEVRTRTTTSGPRAICSFDGIRVPFQDNSFDLVYSSQVFEHVRHPEPLLHEVRRVLRPGGLFFGSTSSLEPFHSYSYWNYSPFGFIEILKSSGLTPLEIRPGIDALTLICRQILKRPRFMERYFRSESPLHRLINLYSLIKRLQHDQINALKLQFAGTFFFIAQVDNSSLKTS